jgi:hypothetical protein
MNKISAAIFLEYSVRVNLHIVEGSSSK